MFGSCASSLYAAACRELFFPSLKHQLRELLHCWADPELSLQGLQPEWKHTHLTGNSCRICKPARMQVVPWELRVTQNVEGFLLRNPDRIVRSSPNSSILAFRLAAIARYFCFSTPFRIVHSQRAHSIGSRIDNWTVSDSWKVARCFSLRFKFKGSS